MYYELPKFIQLKKLIKENGVTSGKKFKLAVCGNASTQHIAEAIRGYSLYRGLNVDVLDADYDQIEIQLLDSQSDIYSYSPDAVFIFLSSEKLYSLFCGYDKPETFAEVYFEKMKRVWDSIESYSSCKIIQTIPTEFDDGVFGNYSGKTDLSFLFQIRKLMFMIMSYAMSENNIYMLDLQKMQSMYGRYQTYSEKSYYMSKICISLEFLPRLAKSVVDIIEALSGKVRKCIVVDLDNTLWGGVVGDVGINGIEIGDYGRGQVFTDIQRWLKALKNRGILLAVCSKNDEDKAKEPFLSNPDMVLRLEDFVAFKANWKEKNENIIDIQKDLNIGMDSFVFIDDNPFERNLIRSMLPQVFVPELPDNPEQYLDYLRSINLFEMLSFSEEDSERTKQYQIESQRKEAVASFASYEEYLDSLNMEGKIESFSDYQAPRISQLSQRSNQFNLRTIRYSTEDVINIKESSQKIGLSFSLKDRYGSYGLVSVVVLELKDNNQCFIEEWFMSCRVLKREMEQFIINSIVSEVQKRGIKTILGQYIPTSKNAMVKSIYGDLGFEKVGDDNWLLQVESFKPLSTHVVEERE